MKDELTYELALELKNAGFPSSRVPYPMFICKDGIAVEIPPLEELISALGELLGSITREDNGTFYAVSKDGKKRGDGANASEATAKLWLITR